MFNVNKIETYKFIKAKSGANSVLVKQFDQKPFHLHSTVDPNREAQEWVNHIKIEDHTTYIVFGCGLGYHVRALWEKLPPNSILCVFVTETEAWMVTQAGNKSPVNNLQNKRLFWIKIIQLYDIAVAISNTMIEYDIKKIQLCKYYPAMRLNADFYDLCEKNIIDLIGEKMSLTFNVNISTGRSFIENYWRNVPYIAANPGIIDFENLFKDWPCIVVAAGPSLNKNIQILKECLPYAVVIAAGSTMGALHRAGITPHFLVVTDANSMMFDDLDGCCDENTVLIASNEVYPKVVSRYPGRLCFIYTSDDDRNILEQQLPLTARLKQTASVATVAVDFARYCGAGKIIMVGQDLAFSEDRYHAEGVRAAGYEEKELVEVPGYHGGTVPTVYSFKAVIEYLESYVSALDDKIHFINATEGGAKLQGMEQMPLFEVKEKYFAKKLPVADKIDSVFQKFNESHFNKNTLRHEIGKHQEHSEKIIKMLEEFEKKYPDFRAVSEEMELDLVLQKTKELYGLIDTIRNHEMASSYKIFLIPRIRLIEFYKQDGLHATVIYELYLRLFNEFKEFMGALYEWISNALNALDTNKENRDES